MALALSIPAGIPVFILAHELGVYGGDEGRWQRPYAAGMGFLFAALVFAYTFPATRRHWGDGNGAVVSVLTAILGCFGIFLGSLGTLIMWFVLGEAPS